MKLDVSIKGLNAAVLMLDSKIVRRAARMALNESLTTGRKVASQQIRKRWNLKTDRTKKELTKYKLASNTDLTGIIRAKGRPIDLINFGAKWKRGRTTTTSKGRTIGKKNARMGGVLVEIQRGKRIRLPSAFIASTGSHTGVFERMGKSSLPLRNMAVITMASMFDQDRVMLPTMTQINDRMAERFGHHLDRLMK